jgi:hypothetical protein
MQEERNCKGLYGIDALDKFYLADDLVLDECPVSYVTLLSTQTIDLFFSCYTKKPGFSGWELIRSSLPEAGAVVDQVAWVLDAFKILESEFYSCQQNTHGGTSHEDVTKKFEDGR